MSDTTLDHPAWVRALPLHLPPVTCGMNVEGLTWEEWEAAARVAAGRPESMLVTRYWAVAWQAGLDPTDMGETATWHLKDVIPGLEAS